MSEEFADDTGYREDNINIKQKNESLDISSSCWNREFLEKTKQLLNCRIPLIAMEHAYEKTQSNKKTIKIPDEDFIIQAEKENIEVESEQPNALKTIATERSSKSKDEDLNKLEKCSVDKKSKKDKKKVLTELESNKEKLNDILLVKAQLISELESNQQKIKTLPALEQELQNIDISIKEQCKIKSRLNKSRVAYSRIIESIKNEIWMLSQY